MCLVITINIVVLQIYTINWIVLNSIILLKSVLFEVDKDSKLSKIYKFNEKINHLLIIQ